MTERKHSWTMIQEMKTHFFPHPSDWKTQGLRYTDSSCPPISAHYERKSLSTFFLWVKIMLLSWRNLTLGENLA